MKMESKVKGNALIDLNNLLMEAADIVADASTKEEVEIACKKAKALAQIGKVVVANAAVCLEATKLRIYFRSDTNLPPMIESSIPRKISGGDKQ